MKNTKQDVLSRVKKSSIFNIIEHIPYNKLGLLGKVKQKVLHSLYLRKRKKISNLVCIDKVKAHNFYITTLDYFYDEAKHTYYLASGSVDNSIKIWNIDAKECLFTLIEHKSYISALLFIPSKGLLISGGDDGCVIFWKISENYKKIYELASNGTINGLIYNKGNLMISSKNDTIRLINIDQVLEISREEKKKEEKSANIKMFTDSRMQITSCMCLKNSNELFCGGKYVGKWNIEESLFEDYSEMITDDVVLKMEYYHNITHKDLGKGKELLFCGFCDSGIKIFDLEKKTIAIKLIGHYFQVNALKIIPDVEDFTLVSAGYDKSIRIWSNLREEINPMSHLSTFLNYSINTFVYLKEKKKAFFITGGKSNDLSFFEEQ